MQICHVITKPELGGAQLSTLNLISNLPKNIYQISVITSPCGMLSKEFKKLDNVKIYFTPFLIRCLNPIVDILALIHIYSIYSINKFDIIHTHSSKAGIIGRWAGVLYNISHRSQVIHTVHGWPFNDYQDIIKKGLFIFLEKITARFTTKIICVSRHDIETGVRRRIAPREKFILIKYGIPLHRFKSSNCNKEEKKKELGINNSDPVVGMIACLKPQKAPLDYIKACIDVYKAVSKVNFLLIGDGALRKRCEEELRKSTINPSQKSPGFSPRDGFKLFSSREGVSVFRPIDSTGRFIFTGWRRDVSEILDIIDIVVLTSKWEGFPISIIEALSKGKPVVASDTGGIKELVKHGVTGYITRPGQCSDTADSILKILKDKDCIARMGIEAVKSIDDSFDIERMVHDIDGLYRRLA